MTALRGRGGSLVDIGSGDGRIVLGEVAWEGFQLFKRLQGGALNRMEWSSTGSWFSTAGDLNNHIIK